MEAILGRGYRESGIFNNDSAPRLCRRTGGEMTYHTTEELIGGRSEWAVSPNNFNGLIDSHLLANQRIAELEAQLAVEKETWRCFHCGFETADRAEAEAHFGDRDDAEEFKPLCRWWASMSPEDRGETLQDTIEQLNSERDENAVLRSKIDGLEYRIHGIVSEIKSFKPFRNCESIHQVFHVYDSMEGRMLVAGERIAALEAALQVAREALAAYANKGNWTAQDEYTLMCNIWRGPEGHTVAEKALARIEEKEVSRG